MCVVGSVGMCLLCVVITIGNACVVCSVGLHV